MRFDTHSFCPECIIKGTEEGTEPPPMARINDVCEKCQNWNDDQNMRYKRALKREMEKCVDGLLCDKAKPLDQAKEVAKVADQSALKKVWEEEVEKIDKCCNLPPSKVAREYDE